MMVSMADANWTVDIKPGQKVSLMQSAAVTNIYACTNFYNNNSFHLWMNVCLPAVSRGS